MADPTDDEIEAWADSFIKQHAYNRAVAVQIATAAAKWVRGQRVQVGWYHEAPALGTSGLHKTLSDTELAEWRRLAHVWPVYRAEREALPGIAGVSETRHHTFPPQDADAPPRNEQGGGI